MTNQIKCITFRFVKGGNPGDGVKTPWGSGIQTPSYILSPLDSGPQKFFWFRMPNFFFSFPSFRGIRKHRRETGGVFLFFTVFINYKNGAKKTGLTPDRVMFFHKNYFAGTISFTVTVNTTSCPANSGT